MSAPLKERLAAIAEFLPIFEREGYSFGKWHEEPGTFPWFELSDNSTRFIAVAYDFGWVAPEFDWPKWAGTPTAHRLIEDPDAVAKATAKTLEHLLTMHIRADRFNEGHLATMFESGHILAIVRRANALLQQPQIG